MEIYGAMEAVSGFLRRAEQFLLHDYYWPLLFATMLLTYVNLLLVPKPLGSYLAATTAFPSGILATMKSIQRAWWPDEEPLSTNGVSD